MSEKTYGYYPGCSGTGTSLEYDRSTRAVCAALGVKLIELPDWNCCGSSPAHNVDPCLSSALAARNFAEAEKIGVNAVLTPCPSCLKNLHNALEHMRDGKFKEEVDALTGRPLEHPHSISSVLQVITEEITPEVIAGRIRNPLRGLKVVAYYGCLMTRPGRSMKFDHEENPTSIDRLMQACGAEVLPFPLKTECCGASLAIPRADVVARLAGRILDLAGSVGADAVVVGCPLCQMNLDLRQGQINSACNKNFKLPVFYYTQLLGLALGLEPSKLGLNKLVVDPAIALAKIGRAADAKAENLEAVT